MAHSPTPWVIDPRYPSEVQTPEDETVCSVWHSHAEGQNITVRGVLCCSIEESAANAALIVRAVNAFEANEALIKELVEALEEMKQWISGWDPNFIQDDEWPEFEDRMDAALAKAEARS